MSSETPSRGVGRQKGTSKVGAFERFKFSQVWDESTQGAQEEQCQPSDWQKENIHGPLKNLCPGGAHEENISESSDLRQIPDSRWICRNYEEDKAIGKS
jgi:hypothetical protein